MNSDLLQKVSKVLDSLPVTRVKSVLPKLFHLPVSHLLCFLNLLRVELHLGRANSAGSSSLQISFVFTLIRIHVAIIIIMPLLSFDLVL